MKFNASLFVALVTLLVIFENVQAQEEKSSGVYHAYGRGNDSCATFIKAEERRGDDFFEEMQWVSGYISSKSYRWSESHNNHPRDLDIEGKIAALKNYCIDNKTVSLATSAEALWLLMMIRTPEIVGK